MLRTLASSPSPAPLPVLKLAVLCFRTAASLCVTPADRCASVSAANRPLTTLLKSHTLLSLFPAPTPRRALLRLRLRLLHKALGSRRLRGLLSRRLRTPSPHVSILKLHAYSPSFRRHLPVPLFHRQLLSMPLPRLRPRLRLRRLRRLCRLLRRRLRCRRERQRTESLSNGRATADTGRRPYRPPAEWGGVGRKRAEPRQKHAETRQNGVNFLIGTAEPVVKRHNHGRQTADAVAERGGSGVELEGFCRRLPLFCRVDGRIGAAETRRRDLCHRAITSKRAFSQMERTRIEGEEQRAGRRGRGEGQPCNGQGQRRLEGIRFAISTGL